MKLLEKTKVGLFFNLNETKQVPVLDIKKEDLFSLMERIYNNKDYYDINTSEGDLSLVKNPVEKEVARQIISKIKEFREQVDGLKSQLNDKYPKIES